MGVERNCNSIGVFVLGMHRSGTSSLAGMFAAGGLWIGDIARGHNYMERTDVNHINELILSRFGGTWKRPPPTVDPARVRRDSILRALRPYAGHPYWVIKDPRFLFTLDAWLPHAGAHRLVGTFRHPLAVARSLHARDDLPLEQGIALWTRYNRELVVRHRRHSFPLIRFDAGGDDYLDRFRHLCERLGIPCDQEAATRHYDARLISHDGEGSNELPCETGALLAYLVEHA